MNKPAEIPVSLLVRFAFILPLLLIPLLLGSCSTSRIVNSDRVLDPGEHSFGTLIDSDVFVPGDASLDVNYMAGNRIFVQAGGLLSGLEKGSRDSTIYAEQGALVPSPSRAKSVRVVRVDDAEESFRNRFQNLLPPGTETNNNNNINPVVGAPVVGVGWWGGGWRRGGGFNRGRGGFSGGNSRPTLVSADSYRSRN